MSLTRIVCAIEAADTPFTEGIEVDVNGKLGHSPPHVQFTYQVRALTEMRVQPLLLTPASQLLTIITLW